MSYAKFQLKTESFRAELRAIRRRLAGAIAMEMRRIAEDSIEERYSDVRDAGARDQGMLHGRLRKLNAVFVPVVLKHKRPEQWPDLQEIYDARISRRQSTYHGRRRFWVDEVKLDALRRAQLARRLGKLSPGAWKVKMKADYGDVKVTVAKDGRVTKADKEAVGEIVGIMEAMFAERASAILYAALQG